MLHRLLVVVVVSLPLLVVGRPQFVSACSCGATTQAAQFAWSELVFRGSVSSVEDADRGDVLVQFHAAVVWKGQATHTISLRTYEDEGGCGYPFEVGREYVVYSKEGGVSLCSWTSPVDDMQPRDFVLLGNGHAPVFVADSSHESVHEQQASMTEATQSSSAVVSEPPRQDLEASQSIQGEHNYWITVGAVVAAIAVTASLCLMRWRRITA